MIGFLQNPKITVIKILAIIYITIIYGIGGIYTGIFLDKYVYKKLYINAEEEKKKTKIKIQGEMIIIIIIYGIVTYLGRNILQEIPFPLEGVAGFEYMRVKEVASGALYGMFILIILSTLTNKAKVLKELL
jgi:hypothetical protein